MTRTVPSPNPDIPLQRREREAQLLADLVRLSRLTLLYGETGCGKTSLLRYGVMPLLEGGRGNGATTELPIFFDAWDGVPLPALQSRIHQAGARISPVPVPHGGRDQTLVESLTAWQEALGVTFFIVFDKFEEYLAAPLDREGIREFAEQFVEAVNKPYLKANFLLATRQDAEPLLSRFHGRIAGLGDASLRLPALNRAMPPPLSLRKEDTPANPIITPALEVSGARPDWLESWRKPATQPQASEPAAPPANPPRSPAFLLGDQSDEIARGMPGESAALPTKEAIAAEIAALARLPEPWVESAERIDPPPPPPSPSPIPSAPGARPSKRFRRAALASLAVIAVIIPAITFFFLAPLHSPPKLALNHATQQSPSAPFLGQPDPSLGDSGAAATPSLPVASLPPNSILDTSTAVPSPLPPARPVAKEETPLQIARSETLTAAAVPKNSAVTGSSSPAAVDPPRPMVYIHVRDYTQRARAETMIRPLAEQGIRVTGIKVVKRGPGVLDLRYFHREEQEEAEQVARALRAMGIRPQLKRVAGYETRAPLRQYELWLPTVQ